MLAVALALVALQAAAPDTLVPRSGLVIARSAVLVPGTYRLPAPPTLESAVITVRGSDLVVDLTGVTLLGQAPGADPDQARGVAIHVDGGRNVAVRGGRVHGYHVGLRARGTVGLVVEGMDLSHGWKPRLYSRVGHESLVDWLSFHHNEAGEWARFGAAMTLDGVRGGRLSDNTAVQGMNGLLLARTEGVTVRGNTFAFNSGLGIGLYRSSHNVIVANTLDFNVRGYSHGHYARGQDSAALLLFEQSSRNVIAWNSATHSGDGLFLWAGQHTMDTGRGGSNDNLVVGNDFRWAPTNAMEATFSRNRLVGNLAGGSTHGLWGGYSWGSEVRANCFGGNQVGIALEHGQDNRLVGNWFEADVTAIRLWANPIEPGDWGYPRHRDTRSRDTEIAANMFAGNRVGIRASATTGLRVSDNEALGVDTVLVADSLTRDGLRLRTASGRAPAACGPTALSPSAVAGLPIAVRRDRPAAGREAGRDRSAIIVDEWGPFDWQSPKLWPVDDPTGDTVRLRVVGPAGAWEERDRRGLADVSASTGRVGDTIRVVPAAGPRDWALSLVFRGMAGVSPRGVATAAGEVVPFGYSHFEPGRWRVRFFALPGGALPLADALMDSVFAGPPLLEREEAALDLMWYRPPHPGLPRERFAVEATSEVTLPPGEYTLGTISDDAVRVWVNGALLIDHWTPHGSELAFAPLAGGTHRLRVRHYQGDGWTELRAFIVRGVMRSPGSPGPH